MESEALFSVLLKWNQNFDDIYFEENDEDDSEK